jgi:prophage regulatory protein
MNIKNQPRILRKPDILALTSLSKSTLYNRIKDGLFPPQISLGARAVGFVQSECELVIQAMIEGQSSDQIKCLVKELIDSRTSYKGGI